MLDEDVEIDNAGLGEDEVLIVDHELRSTLSPNGNFSETGQSDWETIRNGISGNDTDKYTSKMHVGDNANVFPDGCFQKADLFKFGKSRQHSNERKISNPFFTNAYLSPTHWRLNYAYANQRPDDVGSYRYEYNRLFSFDNRWLLIFPVTPIDLARAGFYYLGPDDRVQCFSCKIVLKRWERGDSPHMEHTRLSRNCFFLQNMDNENIPLVILFSRQKVTTNVILEASAVTYEEFEDRLKSFIVDGSTLKEEAEHLAKCGFYLEIPETIRCYKCQMKMIELPDNADDIYDAHRKDSPGCIFADVRNKTIEVKQELKDKEDDHQKIYNNDIDDDEIIFTNVPSHNPDIAKEVHKADDIPDSPAVAAMIAMGYNKNVVLAATEKHQNETGKEFNNVIALFEAIENIKSEPAEESLSEGKIAKNVIIPELPTVEMPSPSLSLQSESSQTNGESKNVCKVCMDSEISISLHPCGHCLTCMKCSEDLKQCPVCRHEISTKCRIYLP